MFKTLQIIFIKLYFEKIFLQKEKIIVPLQSNIAGWSSWQLVGLITRRSQVRVLFPLLRRSNDLLFLFLVQTRRSLVRPGWRSTPVPAT